MGLTRGSNQDTSAKMTEGSATAVNLQEGRDQFRPGFCVGFFDAGFRSMPPKPGMGRKFVFEDWQRAPGPVEAGEILSYCPDPGYDRAKFRPAIGSACYRWNRKGASRWSRAVVSGIRFPTRRL